MKDLTLVLLVLLVLLARVARVVTRVVMYHGGWQLWHSAAPAPCRKPVPYLHERHALERCQPRKLLLPRRHGDLQRQRLGQPNDKKRAKTDHRSAVPQHRRL